MPGIPTMNDNTVKTQWIRSAVSQFEGRLVRYAAQITGDVESARDVVQDTFMKLCAEQQADLDGHLAQWLFTVCRNRALDVNRKEKRMTTITDKQAATQPGREREQAAVAEQQEDTQRILRLVDGLPDNQREVVRLKFQNGLSYREISTVTELSVSNVGYLLHTAIQRLRKELRVDLS